MAGLLSASKLDERCGDGQPPDPNDAHYALRCIDLERVKYVLRDYLRIRLWKLSQWPQHYLEPANHNLLSDAERVFLRETWELKAAFFEHRLLCALPEVKRHLDERMDLLDMVRRPDTERYVYARIVADVGEIEIPPTFSQDTASQSQAPFRAELGQT